MLLSIVIPAYNEQDYLPDCLTFVRAEIARCKARDDIEVVVVDNASTDDTAAVAAGFEGVRVVHEPEKGLTRARQKGLTSARGEILAYIDADTRMPEGWIDRLLASFATSERVVCVSGPYIYHDAPWFQRVMVNLYWRLLALPSYWITRYMAVGGNFAARRWALERIGGFDTDIAFYGEDTDIARRLSSVGRVWFRLSLPMRTSSRRLHAEGMLHTAFTYVANFLSEVFLKRPITRDYRDVR